MSWDGNPTAHRAAGPTRWAWRSRPAVSPGTTPAGNQDIIYFIYTLYNVSSVRPEALRQHPARAARPAAAAGPDVPGLPTRRPSASTSRMAATAINSVFMDFAADQDVTAAAGANYATFNNLFNLAITYHERFTPAPGNTFDPGIHAPPFMPGPGFVGTKYLRSPILPDGTEAGTVLAGLTTNRGAFPDPNNVNQLYRYISANLNPAAGDPQCNTGDPAHHAPLLHQRPAVRHPDVPVQRPADAAPGRPGDDRGGVHLRRPADDREVPVDSVPGHHDPEPAAGHQRRPRRTRAWTRSTRRWAGAASPGQTVTQDSVAHRARLAAGQGEGGAGHLRQQVPAAVLARPRPSSSWSRATARSPCSGGPRRPRQQGDAYFAIAQRPQRRQPVRPLATASSTSRATASTAAGPTRRTSSSWWPSSTTPAR